MEQEFKRTNLHSRLQNAKNRKCKFKLSIKGNVLLYISQNIYICNPVMSCRQLSSTIVEFSASLEKNNFFSIFKLTSGRMAALYNQWVPYLFYNWALCPPPPASTSLSITTPNTKALVLLLDQGERSLQTYSLVMWSNTVQFWMTRFLD